MARPDQQRFEEVLREHQRIIFKVASMYASHAEDRRDLAQEICTQAWRSFAHFDASKAKFSTWLYRIALNVAISQWRRERQAHTDRFEPLEQHHLDTIGGGEPIAEGDDRLVALYMLIGQLDPLHRALILLYLEDRSYAEIADILGVSETNVATKISRIKQTWRDQLTSADTTGA